jgi:hypothetical protein
MAVGSKTFSIGAGEIRLCSEHKNIKFGSKCEKYKQWCANDSVNNIELEELGCDAAEWNLFLHTATM